MSSDNGRQFIANDSKEFIWLTGMTHVRTSPLYPQSNGKLGRFHRTLKSGGFCPGQPLELVARFVEHYNNVSLHSAIGYIAPADFLAGRVPAIWAERERKLDAARELRRVHRAELHQEAA